MNAPAHSSSLRRPVPAGFIEALQAQLGERVSVSQAVREHHGRDESPFVVTPPDAVVFAESLEDVVATVQLCSTYGFPLIPFGSGSSLEGQVLAIEGGVCLDMSRMNKVLSVDVDDLTATVQAGVSRKQLNNEIRDTGLFFPIDPGADASLGGMCATRASGTNAVRYGTMRENVMSLTVVTAQGKVIRTARRAKKSSAGYDLTRMYIGSEGTLGVIVEVTIKLYPQPEAVSAAVCNFETVDAAVQAVIQTIQMGIPVARVEFLDAICVGAINRYSKLTLRETPLLLFEFHGSEAGVQEQAALVQEITRDYGGMDFEWATLPEDRNRLWAARHNAYFATLQLRPGARASSTDVCVPISRLADCIRETNQDLAAASFPSCIVGHVGDGNFHVQMLVDPTNPVEWAEAETVNRRMVQRSLSMDGTCSGEHGVGLHKMQFMQEEHGDDALDVMRQIKHALDPLNIMNPGKIISWDCVSAT